MAGGSPSPSNGRGQADDVRHRDNTSTSRPRCSRDNSRPRCKNADTSNSSSSSSSSRRGLRIFISSANLGNASPDPDSLAAWLPHHGKAHHVLRPDVEPSHVVDGVSKESWNGVDARGKIEVIAIGMQESVPGSSALTMTGVTALFTGTNIKQRKSFATALGKKLGKPIDDARKNATELIGTQADVGGTKQLKTMVTNHIGEDYTLMTEYQRGEMVFYLFLRNDLTSISSVTGVQAHNCGIGSVMANKGGIATLLTIGSTRLSFLSCHLAAGRGLKHYEERNSNMKEIIRGLGAQDPTLSVHHAFVLGDLNYRFSLSPPPKGTKDQKVTKDPKDEAISICRTIIDAEDWETLGKFDELGRALRDKMILVGFQTHPIRTCPTYRCERKEGIHYDYERIPSHTDRILWKSVEETPRSIEPLIYEPIPKFSTSDHKPVRGLFFLPNRPSLKLDPKKTILHISLTGLKCKSLKPSANIMQSDIDTYLDFQVEPSILELKSNSEKRRGRTYVVNSSNKPSWPREEVKFQIDVSSKEEIHGAYLYIKCMNENEVLGDSLLGTVVIDLEHIIRRSLGVTAWKDDVERHFLRNSKDVGKLVCDMKIHWEKNSRPLNQQPRNAHPSSSDGRARSKSRTKMSESEKSLLHYLAKLDMPTGLLSTLVRNHRACVKRYWLIDNSASMKKIDSQLMSENFESVKVSRWEELSECVSFHSKMSAKCMIPTTFSLMNAPALAGGQQKFSVCCSNQSDLAGEIDQVKAIMKATPTIGKSSLVQCINDFKKDLSGNASQLSSNGKHVTLVMCTQGLPKEKTGAAKPSELRKFTHAVYSLSKLPVKIVIRSCTDDEKTSRSYNGLESKLDNCEYIDGWWGESLEIFLHNPWLCYGFGIRRLREAGLLWGLFDHLDERPLDLDEIHQFCSRFFIGETKMNSGLPHPRDWKNFMHSLSELVKKEKLQWNTVKKRRTPWVSLSKLESIYGPAEQRGNARELGGTPKPPQCLNEHHKKPRPPSPDEEKPNSNNLTKEEVVQSWSHQPPNYEKLKPLHQLLVTLPTTFPPMNENVEPHEYFSKWKPISKEAFNEGGDELNELLKRATRTAKLFLHPDKLPKDLTENQSFLFREIWDVILASEGQNRGPQPGECQGYYC